MKKVIVMLILILLTSCSSEGVDKYEYTFTGEGESWKGELKSKGTQIWGKEDDKTTYSHEGNYELIITYKGSLKSMKSMKKLSFSYETTAGGGESSMAFSEPPKETSYNIRSSGTGAKVQENEVIQVKVKWDNHEESFELRNKSIKEE